MPPRRKPTENAASNVADLDISVPEISMKSSKQELLDAYQQLVQRLERNDGEMPQAKADAERRRQESTLASTRSVTVNTIVASIGSLKVDLAAVLNNVSQKLVEQIEKFRQLEEATAIESKRLAELHDIEVAADTLATLVTRHREAELQFETRVAAKKVEVQASLQNAKDEAEEHIAALRDGFEAETSEHRAAWLKEQAEHDAAVHERNSRIKREQTREQEEYAYQLKLMRERDADAYAAKRDVAEKELNARRHAVEHDLAKRQEELASHESELLGLRARVEAFPSELQKVEGRARQQAQDEVLREARTTQALRDQEIAGERQLLQLQIQSLQTKVAEQAERLNNLTVQLAEATGKVQDIAVKAIEGAAGRRALDAVNEIALEQAKQKRPS